MAREFPNMAFPIWKFSLSDWNIAAFRLDLYVQDRQCRRIWGRRSGGFFVGKDGKGVAAPANTIREIPAEFS